MELVATMNKFNSNWPPINATMRSATSILLSCQKGATVCPKLRIDWKKEKSEDQAKMPFFALFHPHSQAETPAGTLQSVQVPAARNPQQE
ncbi:hypothetical protein VTN00DRAFT_224 [Thermoascus crustaceus]|uniref:uncharacterized protein n=1 Tax=Thermoascus crustaceus TaxID=5088 RepID=UPI00374292DD